MTCGMNWSVATTSVSPCQWHSPRMCSMIGRLTIGTIGLGRRDVSGRRRVPSPPAMMTAFIGSSSLCAARGICHVRPLLGQRLGVDTACFDGVLDGRGQREREADPDEIRTERERASGVYHVAENAERDARNGDERPVPDLSLIHIS